MKTKITLEVDSQQTIVVLKNSQGHTFEFNPNTKYGEELFDFILSSEQDKSVYETIVGSINKPELKVKCLHCGRKFIAKLHHKCNTGFRKRNHNWEEI